MKRKPTAAEILNDPSLRWVPYRRGELLICDVPGIEAFTGPERLCRFIAYTPKGEVELASAAGIAPLGLAVGPLTVRRPSAGYTAEQLRAEPEQGPAQAPRRTWRGC
jgi:hypothetical protein